MPFVTTYKDPIIPTMRSTAMSERLTLYERPTTHAAPARLTIEKIRRPLSKAAQNLLAKATEMEATGEARDVDDAIDTLRLSNDADYMAVAAETGGTVAIAKAAPDAPSPFEVMTTEAHRRVSIGKARDFVSAVDQLRTERHWTYQAWMGRTTPAPTTVSKAADEVTTVVKAAQEQRFAKKRAVHQEITKRTTALVRSGQAASEMEALRQVFKDDRELYEEYRKHSYADGPMFTDTAPAPVVAPDKPAYATARKLALEMRQNDPWNQYGGLSEVQMIEKVFAQHPGLYQQVREEGYSHR